MGRPALGTIYEEIGQLWTLATIPAPVPDENWPQTADKAFIAFWELKQQKRREIEASIQRSAERDTVVPTKGKAWRCA
ncbi:MAG TPA: hypothetical protein EYP63_06525 [Desulfotomaculum sp.]|nr:hypothetical protein [Desulfotomaculum sp.]